MYIQVQGDDSIKQFSIQPSYIYTFLILSCEKSNRTVEAPSVKSYHESRVYSAHVLAKKNCFCEYYVGKFPQLTAALQQYWLPYIQNVLEIEESLLK